MTPEQMKQQDFGNGYPDAWTAVRSELDYALTAGYSSLLKNSVQNSYAGLTGDEEQLGTTTNQHMWLIKRAAIMRQVWSGKLARDGTPVNTKWDPDLGGVQA